jgi:hypothetical protein
MFWVVRDPELHQRRGGFEHGVHQPPILMQPGSPLMPWPPWRHLRQPAALQDEVATKQSSGLRKDTLVVDQAPERWLVLVGVPNLPPIEVELLGCDRQLFCFVCALLLCRELAHQLQVAMYALARRQARLDLLLSESVFNDEEPSTVPAKPLGSCERAGAGQRQRGGGVHTESSTSGGAVSTQHAAARHW